MPPYFHYLDTQKVGNGTVADIATRAFANLLTAAGKKKNVCVVVSDLAAAYDTGAKLIYRALEDARSELGRSEMSDGSELHESVLRAALYAVMEQVNNVDGSEVLAHLTLNIPDYYSDMTRRELAVELADYLARRLVDLRPDEASAARVLCELVKNQRLG